MTQWIKRNRSGISAAGLFMSLVVLVVLSALSRFIWKDNGLTTAFMAGCFLALITLFKHFMESGSFESIYQWQSNHLIVEHQRNVKETKSPITLNKEGTETIEKLRGREWLNENIDTLYRKFKNIDDEYDIQEKAREVLLKEEDKIREDRKKLLYSTGTSIYTLIAVMSIELRDMVIEKKGLK
ncbi:MAG: hypothetical protein F4X82_00905 [Candidatus Spechtbacteria bacterium SB0662_bin_43]|uniref:Uncharacterized protein n=1 Tax=Candidatus Spechtbacteria bacterium SB0662_bin_43 TaxID=2604897 RepID=A0A845DBN9_9BACT|nr:hypothetical protein [Candidatus Spechtbacteria bacterium SB0662_bin_43]